jgi:hypothetical protein
MRCLKSVKYRVFDCKYSPFSNCSRTSIHLLRSQARSVRGSEILSCRDLIFLRVFFHPNFVTLPLHLFLTQRGFIMSRDCLIATGAATAVSACVTGLGAASSAIGAAIMQKAGWKVAVTTGQAAAAGAAGFATLYTPFIILVTACSVLARSKYGLDTTAKAGSTSTITTAALAGVIGAAELQFKGVELGYVVASTAAGAPIIGTGAGLLACLGICGATYCAGKARNQHTQPDNTLPPSHFAGIMQLAQPRIR